MSMQSSAATTHGAAADKEVLVRFVYTRTTTIRTYVQEIVIPTRDINEDRLFEYILICWGKSPHANELEFLVAIDENGRFLTTAEGLNMFVINSLDAARKQVAEQVEEDILEDDE